MGECFECKKETEKGEKILINEEKEEFFCKDCATKVWNGQDGWRSFPTSYGWVVFKKVK